MVVHSLYIFSKRGTCLYYTEWYRPQNALAELPEEDSKLMFGLIFSLKQLMNKMNPSGEPTNSQLPPFGPDQGFFRYSASNYVLHHLETPTGYRVVMTSDPAGGDLRPALWYIYETLLVGYAFKNPMYTPGTQIENVAFGVEVDRFVRSLPAFAAR